MPSSDSNYQVARYFQSQTTPRAGKIEMAGTIQEIFEELENQLKDFLVQRYIKRIYAEHMTKFLCSCDGESILLQVDFSKNASLISQDAHWSNNHAALFTAHA